MPREEEKSQDSQTLMINFGNISQDLLILQNQIREAATALRDIDLVNPQKKILVTPENIQ